ncbi:TPA: malonate decarboxylase subunit epsilon [Klebsiella oxytoca]|uniref:[acyl-carrier-protein] S-malonyltransferase n=1 Tax=Klebsiella oxytoca TaxID=571 RepID=A0AAN5L6B9_KLEOX|nr:malonate decarboxylase subunit epsilon [Klebsiella oxytoca]
MKILFTFPGQGTQRPGMLQEIPDGNAIRDDVYSVLDEDMDSLDTPEALQHTRAVQLCLLIAGVAWSRALEARGVIPDIVSGLSIGAYPAAVVAGALSFHDALRLVALRGELMEQAYPQGYGLTAIMGLTRDQMEKLIAGSDTWLANLNAETQIVIAGSDGAMAEVAQKALAAGANTVRRLAVSVPSHCVLLDKPAAKLAQAFTDVSLHRPRCDWLSGTTGRVIRDPGKIADDLAFNMARTVQWLDAMVSASQRGAQLAIELPPGSALTRLTRQSEWSGDAISLESSGLDVACHLAKKLRT